MYSVLLLLNMIFYWGSSFYCYSQIFLYGFLQQIFVTSFSSFFEVLGDFHCGYTKILLWKQFMIFVHLFKQCIHKTAFPLVKDNFGF